jgi:hypothetical protein
MSVNKLIRIKRECKEYGTFFIYPAEQENNRGKTFSIWLHRKKELPVGKIIIKNKKKF